MDSSCAHFHKFETPKYKKRRFPSFSASWFWWSWERLLPNPEHSPCCRIGSDVVLGCEDGIPTIALTADAGADLVNSYDSTFYFLCWSMLRMMESPFLGTPPCIFFCNVALFYPLAQIGLIAAPKHIGHPPFCALDVLQSILFPPNVLQWGFCEQLVLLTSCRFWASFCAWSGI